MTTRARALKTLESIQGFAFDLDGTIWAGPHLLPGAVELVTDLRRAGLPVVFASNSSRTGSDALALALTRLGLRAEVRDVVAAFDLVADAILDRLGPVPVLAVGTDDLRESLRKAGHAPVPFERWKEAKAVVVGNDPNFDYGRLRDASRAVDAGAAYFAVNLDSRYPVAGGFDPGCGAMAEAVAVAARVRPIVVGKPHPQMFDAVRERLRLAPDQIAMVGDNEPSDIVGGRAAGMFTVWLRPKPDAPSTPDVDLAVDGLPQLHRLWLDARSRDEARSKTA